MSLADTTPQQGSLVLYKTRPARVVQSGEALEIELEQGRTLKVRQKDVTLLHPGPLDTLAMLQPQDGEVETAWELLAGETTSLAELAELAYGAFTPPTAWATWQLVSEGLYFSGTVTAVTVRTAAEVEQERQARQAKAAEAEAWTAFMERVRRNQIAPEDHRYLQETEQLALGQRTTSRLLRELGLPQNPERAYALLCKFGHWDYHVDPYPQRLGVSLDQPMLSLPALPEEQRVDLTSLPAFAIDDEGSEDPDDALSLHNNCLWVHIADVSALVTPDSSADLEARARGCTLYLPEGTVPMLPQAATRQLGMGLSDVTPALSFGLYLDTDGTLSDVEVVTSWVRVTRLTYAEAEQRLDEAPFAGIWKLVQRFQERRRANGAVFIELPELKVQIEQGQVTLIPLPPLKSRTLVAEAMLMAGEAAARFAQEHFIPLPFTTQDPPEAPEPLEGLAGMFALRRTLKRSQQTSIAAPHAGLGLHVYTRATSPLRRYLDLVVHQQLRAYLHGTSPLGEQEILHRVGAAEAVTGTTRQAERLARKHWTMVYLLQNPKWQGEGVVVEKRGPRNLLLIPELGLEISLSLRNDYPLNSVVPLALSGVSVPDLEAYFRLVD